MTDPLEETPMKRLSEEWWATRTPEIRARRCHAHRKNGAQCTKVALAAQQVCGTHGGFAPQAKSKARRRLEEASDRMAARLLGFAENQGVPAYVALQATQDALDRAGVSAKHAVGVELSMKPHEQLFDGIAIGVTRAESRERRGLPAPESEEVVDAEVVEDSLDADAAGRNPGDRADDPNHRPAFATDDVGPPGSALMTLEEATEGQARYISSQRIHRRR